MAASDDREPGDATAWRPASPGAIEALAAAIAVMTVVFNPLLAIVNGHVVPVSNGVVAVVQAALTFGALALGAVVDGRLTRWGIAAWGLVIAFIFLSVLRGDLVPKNLGDVLLIPAFIGLGQRLRPAVLIRVVMALQVAITAIGVFELAFPSAFGAIFKVLDYYVSTRGFAESAFWAGNDLFVSSERPGGRLLLAGFDLHRGSSLFLEPVSLGNWAVLGVVMLAAFWRRLSWRGRAFLAASNVVLLIVCDGRLAIGVCLLLAVYLPFARKIPSGVSVFYLPGVMLLLTALVAAGYLATVGDTLPGRLRGGYDALIGLDLSDLMGIGHRALNADAGWVFFIQTQSLLIAIIVWAAITLTDIGEEDDARMFKHGLAMFLALCLPISYSVLSIKTMALFWCAYGCFHARRASLPARPRPASAPIMAARFS